MSGESGGGSSLGPGSYETEQAKEALDSKAYRNVPLAAAARFKADAQGLENLGPGAYNASTNPSKGGGAVCSSNNGTKNSSRLSIGSRSRRGRRSLSAGRAPLQTLKETDSGNFHATESEVDRLRRRLRQALCERDNLKLKNQDLEREAEAQAAKQARSIFVHQDKVYRGYIAAAGARRLSQALQNQLEKAEGEISLLSESVEQLHEKEVVLQHRLSCQSLCQKILLQRADDALGTPGILEIEANPDLSTLTTEKVCAGAKQIVSDQKDQIVNLEKQVGYLQDLNELLQASEKEAWIQLGSAQESGLEYLDRYAVIQRDIMDAQSQTSRLHLEKQALQEDLDVVQTSCWKLDRLNAQVGLDLASQQKENAQLTRDLEEERTRQCELESSIELKSSQIAEDEKGLKRLNFELSTTRAVLKTAQAKLSSGASEIESLRRQLDSSLESIDQSNKLRGQLQVELSEQVATFEAQQYELELIAREKDAELGSMRAKLEETEMRLLNSQRVTQELGAQMEKVEEKCTAFQAHQDKLELASREKDAELEGMRAKLGETEVRLLNSQSVTQELGFQVEKVEEKCTAFQAHQSKLELAAREKDAELEGMRAKLAATKARLENSQGVAQKLGAQVEKVEEKCTTFQAQQSKLELVAREKDVELESMRAKLEERAAQLGNSQGVAQNLEARVLWAEEELLAFQAQKSMFEKAAHEKDVELKSMCAKLEESATRLENSQAASQELEAQVGAAAAKVAKLESQAERSNLDIASLQARVLELQAERTEIKHQTAELESQVSHLHARPSNQELTEALNTANAALSRAEQSEASYRAEAHQFRTRLAENNLLKDDERLSREHELAVAKAIGATATQEMQRLAEENAGLAGHSNTRQKIHHLKRVKQENADLKLSLAKLEAKCRRQETQLHTMRERFGSSESTKLNKSYRR